MTTKLHMMVGPSGAGKSTIARTLSQTENALHIESDYFRQLMCGDRKDQSKNAKVFDLLHCIADECLRNEVSVILDATHLHKKDRVKWHTAVKHLWEVHYHIVDRPLSDKLRDKDWRPEFVIHKHDEQFNSAKSEILGGDGNPDVIIHLYGSLT